MELRLPKLPVLFTYACVNGFQYDMANNVSTPAAESSHKQQQLG